MLLTRAVEANAFVQDEFRRFTQCRWIEHPTFQLRGGRSVTEPRSPQRYLFRQCLVVMWCYDVPLGHYWRTNHSRKRIYLALTIYRDFMQSLFLSGFERGGAIRINRKQLGPSCLLVCRRMSSLSFVQKTFDWDSFVWRGRCSDWGTIAPQVSVLTKSWCQDKRWGILVHWIWPRLLSKHFISLLTPQPNVVFFRLAYQSKASIHNNWRVRTFKT